MIKIASQGLAITPAQLQRGPEEDADLQDLPSGMLTLRALRPVADSLAALRYIKTTNENSPDAGAERRQEVSQMLAQEPKLQRAIVTDTEAEPDALIVTLGIQDKATCELRIPNARYDPTAILKLIEAQTGAGLSDD
jgi:hypothetical protein